MTNAIRAVAGSAAPPSGAGLPSGAPTPPDVDTSDL